MSRVIGFLLLLAGCAPAPEPRAHDVIRQEIRPTDTGIAQMFRFDPGDRVTSYAADGGNFRVHYALGGRNGVPARDANDSGVPDFVEEVDRVYEEVGALYQQWGFRLPPRDGALTSNGGDARFDVYLLDFGGSADGAFRRDDCPAPNQEICIGYMVQENDFVGYNYPSTVEATRILGSHEFFHAVQAAYDSSQDVMITEGTAVWATEEYDPQSDDFENFLPGFVARLGSSIDSPPGGPVPAAAYGSALFFRFLSERYDAALVRKLWERLENGRGADSEPTNKADPTWLVQLDALLKTDYQSSFAAAWETFATWNLYTATAADPTKAWRNGAAYPPMMTTSLMAPHQSTAPLRVFYASMQFFRVSTGGRTSMTAALVDDPLQPGDDTRDLVVVGAVRASGRNRDVRRLGAPLDTSGAQEVLLAVVNTSRAAEGSVLSRRPGLCIGTEAEVATCRAALSGLDAGTPQPPDAGVIPSLDQPLPAAKTGCAQGIPTAAWPLLAIFTLLLRRRTS